MNRSNLIIRTIALPLIFMIAAGIFLSELYASMSWLTLDPIRQAATVHTIIAALTVVFLLLRRGLDKVLARPVGAVTWHVRLAEWVPILFLGALVGMSLTTRIMKPGYEVIMPDQRMLTSVLWVPIVEELTFRVAFGGIFRAMVPGWLGMYYSAAFFSYMHSWPSWDRVLGFHIGFPLGPLVLGIVCELLYNFGGRIQSCIFLHVVANASVFIFGLIDARWLNWFALDRKSVV